jgi:hypothetical protein
MEGAVPDYTVEQYVRDLRAIRDTGAATAETSFYPPVDRLFNAAGDTLKPKVLFSTQLRSQGAGMPDGGFFPQRTRSRRNAEPPLLQNPERGVVEIKPATYSLDSLTREPQTLRYLQQYGLVLITNLREFRLVQHNPSGQPSVLERYILAASADNLWHHSIDPKHNELLPDFLRRVMLYKAPLSDPKDVAWLLASYAREARARAEDHHLSSFDAVKTALQESLGIQFEGERGDHFFRSTLVQTLFYGIFSAWILWHQSEGRTSGTRFDWRVSAHYLRVPVLRQLFNAIADPGSLNAVQLTEVLHLAGEALNRVQSAFFDTFRTEEAVAYFYEPFLEAFDPELRKELGVWYTPREIVHYMVERVDQLLRTELGQPLGLASPNVRILDPCCGTGAYLTSVLQRIHRTMVEQAGDDNALVPHHLREAALTRVFGFEIMPAPFVIAHMELASLLEAAGAPLADNNRARVYLTNALTGWVPVTHPQTVMYPEMEQEREASENIKQQGTILVILGNPPYNGYAGIAKIEEERDLTLAYHSAVEGLPVPQGQGLNDFYIRFFRIAERRIVKNREHRGIMAFISNYSWLDGLSHPTMRHHLLHSFDHIYIDNLHGDRRISEYAPDGRTSETIFAMQGSSVGIKVGTAIATLVKTVEQSGTATVHYRDFDDARASDRRQSMLASLTQPAAYLSLQPNPALGLPLKVRAVTSSYLDWPRLPELFPMSFSGIKTARDSFLVSIDRDPLLDRMTDYYDSEISDSELGLRYPIIMKDVPRYEAKTIRRELISRRQAEMRLANQNGVDVPRISHLRSLAKADTEPYYYRPFDLRWLYYEHHTKLLDEKRKEYRDAHLAVPSMISAQANRRSYDPPVITRSLASYHVIERASLIFPLKYQADTAPGLTEEVSNLTNRVAEANLSHNDSDDFFFHALATMHTPQYRIENAGALLGDWPRIPLPSTGNLLSHSAVLGRRLAELLDPESEVEFSQTWKFIGRLNLPQHANLDTNLKVTAGWGYGGQGGSVMPGRGLANSRAWSETERDRLKTLAAALGLAFDQILSILGETCLDIHLNVTSCWSSVPVNVWEYTLGGYQVLKKWLSYREYVLLERPLQPGEVEYFSDVVRRIVAILLLVPALNESYAKILPTATGLPAH